MSARRFASMLALLLPAAVWACPVCGAGPEESQGAYIAMTALLSLLPLALMGGIVFWLYRSQRAFDRGQPPPPSPQSTTR